MPVHLPLPQRESLLSISGVSIGTARAGIRKPNRRDVLLITLAHGSTVAGVFTQSAYAAAPVQVCRRHLASAVSPGALLVNTGCANAATGEPGLADALISCSKVSEQLGIAQAAVLPFSTGVILERLPLDRLEAGIEAAAADLGRSDWLDAAEAIMTTDTQPKAASRRVQIGGKAISLTGISKGAGMIRPNMATMLGFLATDAAVEREHLQALLAEATAQSFNAITIDGDTSTNDSFVAIATGAAGLSLSPATEGWAEFRAAVLDLSLELAQAIVRDGEGATKFITVQVEGAGAASEARQVAYAIAHSPLIKTAFFASDPNLGRILAAIGYAGVPGLDPQGVSVWLGDVLVSERGGRAESYTEEQGAAVMAQSDILVRVALGRGGHSTTVYTCDFSTDYVRINADYRS